MRLPMSFSALVLLAACGPAPAPDPAPAPATPPEAIAEHAGPTGNDLAAITAVWGVTPMACAPTNDSKDGVLQITASEILSGIEALTIISVDWQGETATVLTRYPDETGDDPAADIRYTFAHDPAAGTLTWTNTPSGAPTVYQRCP